jgi:flavin reductase (DIM6/NTAB) family NADH-FMN oxidoreductase RutF
MQPDINPSTVPFTPNFFPLHLALLTVGDNLMPMGYWTVISKDPFRVLISMGVGNYSLGLLQKYKEAALHFMPWSQREKVVRAGWISGRDGNKAQRLGFNMIPAKQLTHTKLVEGADTVFELQLFMVLENISREFLPHVMDVVACHGKRHGNPILFLTRKDFATLGESWKFQK